jgi:hypothetical protein
MLLNHLKLKLEQKVLKNLRKHFTITNINWLMLFKEIIPVYAENNRTKHVTKIALMIVKTAGTYSYHWALK